MLKKELEMTLEELARLTQEGFETVSVEVRTLRKDVDDEVGSLRKEMATKTDLRESEERLLHAIRAIEIGRPEFEDLQDDVKDLTERVESLEKRS